MRPYVGYAGGTNPDFCDTAYAVTHVVYTQNHYHQRCLPAGSLPEEFHFLKMNIEDVLKSGDTELLGEFVDSLRAFGLTRRHPAIRASFEFLLSSQNADGSWGDTKEPDLYTRFHTTWSAIDGLREYRRCQAVKAVAANSVAS